MNASEQAYGIRGKCQLKDKGIAQATSCSNALYPVRSISARGMRRQEEGLPTMLFVDVLLWMLLTTVHAGSLLSSLHVSQRSCVVGGVAGTLTRGVYSRK